METTDKTYKSDKNLFRQKARDRMTHLRSKQRYRKIHQIQSLWDEGKIDNQKDYRIIYTNPRGSIIHIQDIVNPINFNPIDILKYGENRKDISSFLVAHNTRDGNVYPKPDDKVLIKEFQSAGKKLGLPMIDYFIVSSGAIYSHTNSLDF